MRRRRPLGACRRRRFRGKFIDCVFIYLGTPRRRFAGAEDGSRVSQGTLISHCDRVRATEYAPRDPCSVLERRHGLAEIVERRAGVEAERLRVNFPHKMHYGQRETYTPDI